MLSPSTMIKKMAQLFCGTVENQEPMIGGGGVAEEVDVPEPKDVPPTPANTQGDDGVVEMPDVARDESDGTAQLMDAFNAAMMATPPPTPVIEPTPEPEVEPEPARRERARPKCKMCSKRLGRDVFMAGHKNDCPHRGGRVAIMAAIRAAVPLTI